MFVAVLAHLVVAALLPAAALRIGRWAFLIGALAPAATLGYALSHAGQVVGGRVLTERIAWAPDIGLELTLRMDPLALLMIVLVSGVGALVLAYYSFYAAPLGERIGRNAGLLVLFAGAMLGLVLADDLFTLYVFWELTTVCSFLLVGGGGMGATERRAALQALLVTAFGGLAMLLGFVLLGEAAGTYRISEILATPPSGAQTGIAVALILLGALTKSAQIPFHPWLPAAMVAPTPVSAYLHAAAMVKAGVYLVARFAPGFAGLPVWWIPLVVIGLWTMLLGGYRALRETDLKILLAYGTVSQLGFLMVLLGFGGATTAVAGATMLLAHGLFKSALFLAVGVIDHQTGTRDIRRLSGIGRNMPWLAAGTVLAAASMAGLPPLLGFIGKEAAFSTFTEHGSPAVLVCVLVGSMLTVAYSIRFAWGALATKPGLTASLAPRPGAGLLLPILLPALAGLVLGVFIGPVDALATAYAQGMSPGPGYHLALWHGLNLPLLESLLVLAGGYLVHRWRGVLAHTEGTLPEALHAQRLYQGALTTLDVFARELTRRLQTGSLPVYLGVLLLTLVLVPGVPLVLHLLPPVGWRLVDTPLQLPLALGVLVATGCAVLARRRFTAVLLTGVIGYGIGAIFVLDGAPDLALAQFLVESLTLIVFAFVLRRLPPHFTHIRRLHAARWTKLTIAVLAGTFVAFAAVTFSGVRQAAPEASREYIARAQQDAGATNVVNAIIVDFRAFDTVGEISVLAIAATGAASLVLAAHRSRRRLEPEVSLPPGSEPPPDEDADEGAADAGEGVR